MSPVGILTSQTSVCKTYARLTQRFRKVREHGGFRLVCLRGFHPKKQISFRHQGRVR